MWETINDSLYKKFVFADFTAAFAFMTKVALAAEKQQHHPRWSNIYNTVEIWLNTHEAGNKITEKDKLLSETIDSLF